MNQEELSYYFTKFKFGEDHYHNLMKFRVRKIILISSFYDAYVLERDGQLSEQLYGEYLSLDLSMTPQIKTVTFSDDILDIMNKESFDLVIIMMRIGKVAPHHLAKGIKKEFPDIPILLLLNKQSYVDLVYKQQNILNWFDDVFLWNGDAKIFLAMVKLIEDKKNVDHDVLRGHIRVVLVVENSIDYYSKFLPVLYSEGIKLTQELINSELNDSNKRLKMKTRPKIILVHNYEDALSLYNKYQDHVICIISNVYLKINNDLDPYGGIKLIREIRESNPSLPILIQSSNKTYEIDAYKNKVDFLDKNSQTLLYDVRQFLVNNLGFGDFIFKDKDGVEISRAKSMYEFENYIKTIPNESLQYHAERNHFSAWLMAHGEVQIAHQIRYIVMGDFLTIDYMRDFLSKIIHKIRSNHNKGKVIEFDTSIFTEDNKIVQLSKGSLGGKGRGLAFLNALITTIDLEKEFEGIELKLPKTAIIGTNEFDDFMENNRIEIDQIITLTDIDINKKFVQGKINNALERKLTILLENFKKPLAIRSSGLLEDSQSQPFAGVYQTYMLPNSSEDFSKRLKDLMDAIKIVFCSPFQQMARKYIESINYNLDEEKMAVVIQEIVGTTYNEKYYLPHFSGTGQSYNFYPPTGMDHHEGIVALAVGLGKAVVDGERAHRFCPDHPKIDFLKPEDIVENNQREFYTLNLNNDNYDLTMGEDVTLEKKKILNKHKEGIFFPMTSVWDYEHFSFLDGKFTEGPRVLTYRNIIHYNQFPLAGILKRILDIGEISMGVPVEIEFAVNLDSKPQPIFYILQIRPLLVNEEEINLDKIDVDENRILLKTNHSIGNGITKNIRHVIYIEPDVFDNTQTIEMAQEIEELNKIMEIEDEDYILVGFGRWGSSDRFLGIPVYWAQINKAKVIIESSMENFTVEASQGSHFFHNIISMNVGYLTVDYRQDEEIINWESFKKQKVKVKKKYFTLIEYSDPITVKIDGRSGKAIILIE